MKPVSKEVRNRPEAENRYSSLDSGFGLYVYKPEEKAKVDTKFGNLTDDDLRFYHNALPFMLLTSGIGIVSEETIPTIAWRHERFPVLRQGTYSVEGLTDYLKRFIGFRANVGLETNSEWFKRHSKWDDKIKTNKDITRIEKEFKDYWKNATPEDLLEEQIPQSATEFKLHAEDDETEFDKYPYIKPHIGATVIIGSRSAPGFPYMQGYKHLKDKPLVITDTRLRDSFGGGGKVISWLLEDPDSNYKHWWNSDNFTVIKAYQKIPEYVEEFVLHASDVSEDIDYVVDDLPEMILEKIYIKYDPEKLKVEVQAKRGLVYFEVWDDDADHIGPSSIGVGRVRFKGDLHDIDIIARWVWDEQGDYISGPFPKSENDFESIRPFPESASEFVLHANDSVIDTPGSSANPQNIQRILHGNDDVPVQDSSEDNLGGRSFPVKSFCQAERGKRSSVQRMLHAKDSVDIHYVIINHKYGIDVYLGWTSEDVTNELYDYVNEYWDDAALGYDIPEDKESAIEAYFDMMENEWYEFGQSRLPVTERIRGYVPQFKLHAEDLERYATPRQPHHLKRGLSGDANYEPYKNHEFDPDNDTGEASIYPKDELKGEHPWMYTEDLER